MLQIALHFSTFSHIAGKFHHHKDIQALITRHIQLRHKQVRLLPLSLLLLPANTQSSCHDKTSQQHLLSDSGAVPPSKSHLNTRPTTLTMRITAIVPPPGKHAICIHSSTDRYMNKGPTRLLFIRLGWRAHFATADSSDKNSRSAQHPPCNSSCKQF